MGVKTKGTAYENRYEILYDPIGAYEPGSKWFMSRFEEMLEVGYWPAGMVWRYMDRYFVIVGGVREKEPLWKERPQEAKEIDRQKAIGIARKSRRFRLRERARLTAQSI